MFRLVKSLVTSWSVRERKKINGIKNCNRHFKVLAHRSRSPSRSLLTRILSMGSSLRHLYDSGLAALHPLTIVILLLVFLIIVSSRGTGKRRAGTVALLIAAALLMDLPYESSLLKRSELLKPVFQIALGRDEL